MVIFFSYNAPFFLLLLQIDDHGGHLEEHGGKSNDYMIAALVGFVFQLCVFRCAFPSKDVPELKLKGFLHLRSQLLKGREDGDELRNLRVHGAK